jgi:hypothetical protein
MQAEAWEAWILLSLSKPHVNFSPHGCTAHLLSFSLNVVDAYFVPENRSNRESICEFSPARLHRLRLPSWISKELLKREIFIFLDAQGSRFMQESCDYPFSIKPNTVQKKVYPSSLELPEKAGRNRKSKFTKREAFPSNCRFHLSRLNMVEKTRIPNQTPKE